MKFIILTSFVLVCNTLFYFCIDTACIHPKHKLKVVSNEDDVQPGDVSNGFYLTIRMMSLFDISVDQSDGELLKMSNGCSNSIQKCEFIALCTIQMMI